MSPLRLIASCLLLLVLAAGAHAQSSWGYGALVGASVASQSPGDDTRTGFNLGMYVDYAVLPYAAVSLEAAFVQKGQTYEGVYEQPEGDEVVEIDGTFTIALDYASFTLAAKPSVPLGSQGMSLYAVAGPRLDVLAREKLLFDAFEQSIRISIADHEPTVWGYDAGIGFRTGRLLPTPLIAEVRFSGDLTDAFDGTPVPDDPPTPEFMPRPATRNEVVQVRIGIEF